MQVETVNGAGNSRSERAAAALRCSPAANADPFAHVSTPADPNELKPAADASAPKPTRGRPIRTNLRASRRGLGCSRRCAGAGQRNSARTGRRQWRCNLQVPATAMASDQDISTSKKKKKKGLKKVLAF